VPWVLAALVPRALHAADVATSADRQGYDGFLQGESQT
jgi:hypothetical protein